MLETKDACFRASLVLPGVYHIADPMNVFCTLLVGSERALLFDTGYGLFDLHAFVRSVTDLPLTVLLSHGHHDHACGASLFDKVYLSQKDFDVCRYYLRPEQRMRILAQAQLKNLLPVGFDQEAYLSSGTGNIAPLCVSELDLGGIEVQILPLPGHTPGSLGAFVLPHRLMLIGDNWNPTTWVFFSECERIYNYIHTMQSLMHLPIAHVLAPHHSALVEVDRLKYYVHGLNRETLLKAWPLPITPYEHIHTFACHPEPETTFVFDRDKLCI